MFPYFWHFFFKPFLQTYQSHSRACNPFSFSPFLHFLWAQHSSIKCVQEQRTQLHLQCRYSFQCELHCAIAIACSNVSSIASSPLPMSLGTLCTLPPFVSFFNFLLFRIVLQKTTRNSYLLSSSSSFCPGTKDNDE